MSPDVEPANKEVINCLVPVPLPARTGQAIAWSPPDKTGSGSGVSPRAGQGRRPPEHCAPGAVFCSATGYSGDGLTG